MVLFSYDFVSILSLQSEKRLSLGTEWETDWIASRLTKRLLTVIVFCLYELYNRLSLSSLSLLSLELPLNVSINWGNEWNIVLFRKLYAQTIRLNWGMDWADIGLTHNTLKEKNISQLFSFCFQFESKTHLFGLVWTEFEWKDFLLFICFTIVYTIPDYSWLTMKIAILLENW